VTEPEFRRDLFRGTATYYDRFRVPYPAPLIDDLVARSGADGNGTLLDLACGPGTIAFALHEHFAEVWAVDQEPDMIAVASQKADAARIGSLRLLTSAVEELEAPAASFNLVTVGNAFHRLRRETAAASIFRWLRPGGYVALVWGTSPWIADGEPWPPWREAMKAAMDRWMTRIGAHERIPAGYHGQRERRPDLAILGEAGFRLAGTFPFSVDHEWTLDTLTGMFLSTSVLSRVALGGLAPDFEADLRRELLGCEPGGRFRQHLTFAYELARRPLNRAI
jgi:ubiquinone/menaquinone biosynthesis C-methylase UbiE